MEARQPDTAPAAIADSGWAAELTLRFRHRPDRTVLAERHHYGPLTVQRPFHPEGDGACHTYLLHPPGGVAGGDTLGIRAEVGPNAWALLTTPGAGKVYRSAGPAAALDQHFRVDKGGRLEWLPQENILFDGGRAHLATRIDLAADARFLGWEITCLGRPASGEGFSDGWLRQDLTVYRDGRPLLVERLRLAAGDDLLSAEPGLGDHPVSATLVAVPAGESAVATARNALPEGDPGFGVTRLDDCLVVRYRGPAADRARTALERVWAALRPELLGRPATPPRIWQT